LHDHPSTDRAGGNSGCPVETPIGAGRYLPLCRQSNAIPIGSTCTGVDSTTQECLNFQFSREILITGSPSCPSTPVPNDNPDCRTVVEYWPILYVMASPRAGGGGREEFMSNLGSAEVAKEGACPKPPIKANRKQETIDWDCISQPRDIFFHISPQGNYMVLLLPEDTKHFLEYKYSSSCQDSLFKSSNEESGGGAGGGVLPDRTPKESAPKGIRRRGSVHGDRIGIDLELSGRGNWSAEWIKKSQNESGIVFEGARHGLLDPFEHFPRFSNRTLVFC